MSAVLLPALVTALPKILEFAITAYLKLPELIEAGRDVRGILDSTAKMVKNMILEERKPNDEEWASMNAMIGAEREEFHAPEPDA